MMYLFSLFGLLAVSLIYISGYYNIPFHNEASNGYTGYFISLLLIYGIYKFITLYLKKPKISFSPLGIFGLFVIHLLLLCVIYFNLLGSAGALVLFFKIIGYLILPFILTLITYSFGEKILNLIPSFRQEENNFKFLISLGFGFVLFFFLITIFGSIGLYNYWIVLGIFSVFTIIGYKEIYKNAILLYTKKFEIKNHNSNGTIEDQINLNLLSTEFLFIFITFLIGVNFINIVRPMPIGWDDLGAYMNFPKIMAANGEIIKGAGMIAWQTLTGIGFLFGSSTQAFFLNQLGGILSIIVLFFSLNSLLENKNRFINLPLLGAAIFYAMPMVIFEQAKDMKLDPGLFFVSVIGLYGVIYLFQKYLGFEENAIENEKNSSKNLFNDIILKLKSVFKGENGNVKLFDNKDYLYLIFIIGSIVGLAFAIKFTSLMLILGIIGIIFYSKLGFSGFLGYFLLFIGIFTKFKFWTQLNVNFPTDTAIINNVSYISLGFGILIFIYSFYKYKLESFKKAFVIVSIFIFGVLVSLVPWIIKNTVEVWPNISVSGILVGKSPINFSDYSKIYTDSELKKIESATESQSISSSGKTINEDLGRYFGYENGINNYLKLPYNLTMQNNQNGEYTEISYIFLALIPIIFLFLSFKNPFFSIGVVASVILEYLYFVVPSSGSKITEIFSKLNLPFGYIFIILAFFIPLVYFLYALKNDKNSQTFKLNLVFSTIYVLIFTVAAYGIVWYGITMYFSFILMIMLAGSYITLNDPKDEKNLLRFFGSIVFFLIIGFYFLYSSIPHGFNNLKSAGFNDYKAGLVNQEEGIFGSHPDYFKILATLNLKDSQTLTSEHVKNISNDVLKKLVTGNVGMSPDISKLEGILKEIGRSDLKKFGIDTLSESAVKQEARDILNKLYKDVLYPSKDTENKAGIYRIGTFLTYFISNNRTRYYDDSLVFNFDKYFYNENPDVAVERMKKMGLSYFLVDLNAATIDKDPRHDLTRRFENLLKTFKSSKLELIQTDSICLQIALEEKNENYLTFAGVNYESYNGSGAINRGVKQMACYNHIIELIKNNKISAESYSYLVPFVNFFKQNEPKSEQELVQMFQNYVGHGWLALFKIK